MMFIMKKKKHDYQHLHTKILSSNLLNANKTEALVYGLEEIKNSIDIIYDKIIPELINENLSKDQILNLLWEIREEFRHIDYHIKDSELLDL